MARVTRDSLDGAASPLRVYSCPFDGCADGFTCREHEFTSRLQQHLDVAHAGFTVAELQAQVKHALREEP